MDLILSENERIIKLFEELFYYFLAISDWMNMFH